MSVGQVPSEYVGGELSDVYNVVTTLIIMLVENSNITGTQIQILQKKLKKSLD